MGEGRLGTAKEEEKWMSVTVRIIAVGHLTSENSQVSVGEAGEGGDSNLSLRKGLMEGAEGERRKELRRSKRVRNGGQERVEMVIIH